MQFPYDTSDSHGLQCKKIFSQMCSHTVVQVDQNAEMLVAFLYMLIIH